MSSIANGSARPDGRAAAAARSELTGKGLRTRFALALPLALAAVLATLCLLPSVRQQTLLSQSVLGAAGFVSVWTALYFYIAGPNGRVLEIEVVLRKQHYLQAGAQFSVMLYWG